MIITTAAKTQALLYLTAKDTTVKTLSLKLFSNNASLSDAIVAADLTEVTSGNGYSSISLTGSSWTTNATGTNISYPSQTWTFTGPKGNIYGYYVVDSAGAVLWAETFPSGPYNVQNNGDTITVDITLVLA